jgi:hypothetical protein
MHLVSPLLRPVAGCVLLLAAAGCRITTVTPVAGQGRLNGMPIVFQEDFEHGAARWIPTDPNAWRIVAENGDHVYSQYRQSQYVPPFRSPFNYARIKDLSVGSCVIDARMEQMGAVAGESHRDMVIVFGWQDPAHFYYAHLGKTADDASHQIHIVNGADRRPIVRERTGASIGPPAGRTCAWSGTSTAERSTSISTT